MADDIRKEKRLTAKRVILTSFLVDVLDVVTGLIVAVISGSVVMMTEVLEGTADLVASGLLLLGAQRSLRREDKSHPFGYGREIYFWTLISALIMFGITATMSIYFGWQRLIHPRAIQSIGLAIFVLLIAFCSNGYSFLLSLKRLLRQRSLKHIVRIFFRSSLVETKTTFILDLMGTIAAVIGMVSLSIDLLTGNPRLDGIGAIIIGCVLAVLSIFLIASIRDLLVGRSAAPETEYKIRQAALEINEVDDVLDLKTLHVGSEKLLVNMDVHMSAKLTTRDLERLIDEIKAKVREVVPSVRYLQIELETPDEGKRNSKHAI